MESAPITYSLFSKNPLGSLNGIRGIRTVKKDVIVPTYAPAINKVRKRMANLTNLKESSFLASQPSK